MSAAFSINRAFIFIECILVGQRAKCVFHAPKICSYTPNPSMRDCSKIHSSDHNCANRWFYIHFIHSPFCTLPRPEENMNSYRAAIDELFEPTSKNRLWMNLHRHGAGEWPWKVEVPNISISKSIPELFMRSMVSLFQLNCYAFMDEIQFYLLMHYCENAKSGRKKRKEIKKHVYSHSFFGLLSNLNGSILNNK